MTPVASRTTRDTSGHQGWPREFQQPSEMSRRLSFEMSHFVRCRVSPTVDAHEGDQRADVPLIIPREYGLEITIATSRLAQLRDLEAEGRLVSRPTQPHSVLPRRLRGASAPLPRVVVVTDRRRVLEFLSRAWQRRAEVLGATTLETAALHLEVGSLAGVVSAVSVGTQGECGYEVLRSAARRCPGVPLALIVESLERVRVNGVAALGAALFLEPFFARDVATFLDRVQARAAGVEKLAATSTALAREWGLRPRERELLLLLVAGHGRERICATTGYGGATYKTYVNRLLARSRCLRTTDVVLAVFRHAAMC